MTFNCPHFNPKALPDTNTERYMWNLAKTERRYNVVWGVVNPGNAICAAIFTTKKEAQKYRRTHAYSYVVVRCVVTPLYTCNE